MSVVNVADRILDNLGTMTTMRLQKLAYYAQAHSLASTNKTLFDENFEAWKNGPVSIELLNRYRDKIVIHKGCLILSLDERKNPLNQNQLDLIDEVCDILKDCSGFDLYKRVTKETPWRIARIPYREDQFCEEIILNGYIRTFYTYNPVVPGKQKHTRH